MEPSGESAITGKTTGLIVLGEWVTWAATHFGVLRKLANIIFLNRYMTNLIAARNTLLRQKAEELSEIK